MSKVKVKKQSTFIDMTAMSDVTVLLLTFFMLTANFIPMEPIQVVTPASVSETKVPDFDLITILIDPDGRVFLNLDRPDDKRKTLEKMGGYYNIEFTKKEKDIFAESSTFVGVPMSAMKNYLSKDVEDQKEFLSKYKGIPTDSLNNQLAQWIKTAKDVNGNSALSIKADRGTGYPKVKNVMSTLQDIKENRFSLVTTLRGMPEGQ